MKPELKSYFASIELGPAQSYNNITIIPLTRPGNGPAYATLDEAIHNQTLVVTEVSQSGHVPELKVINRGAQAVLLIDGEELIGARQNRVLNTSILLKENCETVIPVSCTEQGRWSYVSASFAASDVVMAQKSRARKMRSVSASLASQGYFASDQGEVWAEIAELQAKAKAHSPTVAMRDVFLAKQAELETCLKAFTPAPGQTGLLALVDGEVAGFDLVSRPEAYARLHPKLLKSYVIEALVDGKQAAIEADKAKQLARSFLDEAAGCQQSEFPSLGYGTDLRFKRPGLAGTVLWHDQVIHSAFFRLPPENDTTTIASLRRRRRFASE